MIKKLEPHPNVIIRKKIRSKAKLGAMMLEIHDEIVSGEYPTMSHRARCTKFGVHNDSWNKAFGGITKREGNNMVVTLPDQALAIVAWSQNAMENYKGSPAWAKNMVENICLAHLRK